VIIFDHNTYYHRRERAAKSFAEFLHSEMVETIMERLTELPNINADNIFIMGSYNGMLGKKLYDTFDNSAICQCDLSPSFVNQARDVCPNIYTFCHSINALENPYMILDMHNKDIIIINTLLHIINDALGFLIQIHRMLNKNGMFLATLFGGETLRELRDVIFQHGNSIYNPPATQKNPSQFTPMGSVQDWGNLLKKANFFTPLADTIRITVWYEEIQSLIRDLRNMGETSINSDIPQSFSKSSLDEINTLYKKRWGRQDNKIPATFDIIVLTGWKYLDGNNLQPPISKIDVIKMLKNTNEE